MLYYERDKCYNGAMKIEVKHLSFGYAKHPLLLVDGSFCLKSKTTTLLLGCKDCGKSTMLKILTGPNKNYVGEILYDGKSLKELTSKNIQSSLILNPPVFVTNKRVIDELCAPDFLKINSDNLLSKKEKKNQKTAKFNEILLKSANILPNIDKNCKIKKLSSVEKFDVCIARSLLKNPQNVFVELAPEFEITDGLKSLISGRTALIAVSKVPDIKVDKVLFLSMGKLIEYNSIADMEKNMINIQAARVLGKSEQVLEVCKNENGYFAVVDDERFKFDSFYNNYFASDELFDGEANKYIITYVGNEDASLVDLIASKKVNIFNELTGEKIY